MLKRRMKILGLISGGKDSFYNLMQSVANGHELVALANLHPPIRGKKDELDSYMYQTVGHDVIHLYKDCLNVPLYRREISGQPIEQGSDYVITAQDETEDLYELLKGVKEAHPELQAVSVGAILSNYQRVRVENVCARLGLVALAYLWQRNQKELLNEMAQAGVNAILIKVAAIGLKKQHLGRSIGEMYPYLCQMNQEYDLHICGEGGEYETITLDCPLFKRRIIVDESEVVIHANDHFAQVAYLRFKRLRLEDKTEDEINAAWMSDMNLAPVWAADAILTPIEDIVKDKQLSREKEHTSGDHGKSTTNLVPPYQNNKQANDSVINQSKFMTHHSDVVCAIGAKLGQNRLSWAEVVFMQVFVADMKDFGVVNGAYKEFFGINPPPRACVGAHLPGKARIQVNCLAIRKEVTNPKPRRTLHIQGISYWAPANIGPYSQATEQAYHSFIAGQIGMIPRSLDLPEPLSLAKETAWSLRNLVQIAELHGLDLINCTAFCIAYVNNPEHFAPVITAWNHIANKETPAPILVISMPSLPKGAQIEWQVILHHGNVYADKEQSIPGAEANDGYETDDDDLYQLGKRLLHPASLTLLHEQPISSSITSSIGKQDRCQAQVLSHVTIPRSQWRSRTQSWFLTPLLTALSTVHIPETSPLSPLSTSSETDADGQNENNALTRDILKDMIVVMIESIDRILERHKSPAAGPGVEGWENVVGVTLYYHDAMIQQPEWVVPILDELLFGVTTPSLNIAATFVPVQAIEDRGVLAMAVHAVGKMPTIPGLLQV
ncbi:hypothetical protein BGX34_011395 [Mortierella sp. NVP85]|nr:hypothetical protein BGX34_011395 [Mortierella sp. NVP85]